MPVPPVLNVYIGYDPREREAFEVCQKSIVRHISTAVHIVPLTLARLRHAGLYRRDHETVAGQDRDIISDAPMSTEFAISRFLTPILAQTGYALFMDCDMLVRADLAELFALADPRYAVQVVKHDHKPAEDLKMDGQLQTTYARKNWSSAMLWNCDHPGARDLTLRMVNTWPGRRLHAFRWLKDHEIGELPAAWNWLEGTSDPAIEPKIVHYTRGGPWLQNWRHVAYADEWLAEAADMQRARVVA